MKKAVDTNVAIVANGRDPSHPVGCRLACTQSLAELRAKGVIVIDGGRRMLAEYQRHLNPKGQPGVGDQFFQHILRNAANRKCVHQVEVACNRDGHSAEFPDDPELAGFDLSDRVCATVAMKSGAPVLNAVDSDWWIHQDALARHGIVVEFLCGAPPKKGSRKE